MAESGTDLESLHQLRLERLAVRLRDPRLRAEKRRCSLYGADGDCERRGRVHGGSGLMSFTRAAASGGSRGSSLTAESGEAVSMELDGPNSTLRSSQQSGGALTSSMSSPALIGGQLRAERCAQDGCSEGVPTESVNGKVGNLDTTDLLKDAGAGADAGAGTGIGDTRQQLKASNPGDAAREQLRAASPGSCDSPAPLRTAPCERRKAAAVALRQVVGLGLPAPVLVNASRMERRETERADSGTRAADARAARDEAADEQKRLLEEWESTLGAVRAAAGSSCTEVDAHAQSSSPQDECAGPSRLLLLERQLHEAEERARALTTQNVRLRMAASAPRSDS